MPVAQSWPTVTLLAGSTIHVQGTQVILKADTAIAAHPNTLNSLKRKTTGPVVPLQFDANGDLVVVT